MRLCCWLSALTVAVAMYCPDRCRGAERERGREREREITGKYLLVLPVALRDINQRVEPQQERVTRILSLSLSPSVASGQYRFRGRAIEELAVQGKVQHCRQLVVVVEEEETS